MKLNYTKIIVLLVFGILLFAVSSKSQDINSSLKVKSVSSSCQVSK